MTVKTARRDRNSTRVPATRYTMAIRARTPTRRTVAKSKLGYAAMKRPSP